MHPYTEAENEYLSMPVPLTPGGHIDILAIEAEARHARAAMIAGYFAFLFGALKRRRQAQEVQRQLDRAALGIG